MARVTVEDCVLKVPNRFELVLLAAQRSRDIAAGAPISLDRDNDKNPVVALREIAEKVTIYSFSDRAQLVPSRRGVALRDALDKSQPHSGTVLGAALKHVESEYRGVDRLIVLTDEQSHDNVPSPRGKGYVINVASNRNGVGYGAWTHVDGWSEAVVEYIAELERTGDKPSK